MEMREGDANPAMVLRNPSARGLPAWNREFRGLVLERDLQPTQDG
jgi:hypothetical protein